MLIRPSSVLFRMAFFAARAQTPLHTADYLVPLWFSENPQA
jgi:hypothetical protein